jgi:hypothetical protein
MKKSGASKVSEKSLFQISAKHVVFAVGPNLTRL